MEYNELHQRYGSHIATRVQAELDLSEFKEIDVEDLATYLENRAEAAQKEYQIQINNPFEKTERKTAGEDALELLHRRWRDAEDVAYLVAVAEGVKVTTLDRLAAG